MKRTLIILSLLSLFPGVQSFAQKTGFKYDFYGFVRNDFFYSSRQSQTSEEGSFYLFPLDNNYDTEGNDLKARVQDTHSVTNHRLMLTTQFSF